MTALPNPIDGEILDSLKNLLEDEFGELVEKFLEDTATLIDALDEAIRSSDAGAIRKIAHALKSSSSNMGATGLTEAARQLEVLGVDGAIEGAIGIVDRARTEFERVREMLAAEFQS